MSNHNQKFKNISKFIAESEEEQEDEINEKSEILENNYTEERGEQYSKHKERTNTEETKCANNNNTSGSIEIIKECKSKSTIAQELKKIRNEFPIWNTREISSNSKKFTDPIWRQACSVTDKSDAAQIIDPEFNWHSKLESNCRRSSNAYVEEVNRAIYGDTIGHPANDSVEYHQAAQSYALYGKDFLDFPTNLTPLINEKTENTPPEPIHFVGSYGNGLYPTPPATEVTPSVGLTNFNKHSTASSVAATAAYYQMCNGIQAPVRSAAGGNAYGMFLGNKVTYVAAAAAPSASPLVYNQHSSTTTNFISNSLANAALASSPTILYSNPMLTTTTQQYLNTFFKETQYLSGGTAQGTTIGTTTGIYERLFYAQMLQQQIYHQTQQQAAAVAAMFQHKQRTTRATNNSTANSIATSTNIQTPLNSGIGSLNLCGRQATTNTSDILVKSSVSSAITLPLSASGIEDVNAPLND